MKTLFPQTTPLVNLSCFNPLIKISISFGYQGRYFNTIADDVEHYYNFTTLRLFLMSKTFCLGLIIEDMSCFITLVRVIFIIFTIRNHLLME